LKQPQNSPLTTAEQVAVIYTGTNGYLDSLPVAEVGPFLKNLCEYLNSRVPRYVEILSESSTLDTEAEELLKMALISLQKEN
jgi:F-type H+-transporting ATPase subunit alpha